MNANALLAHFTEQQVAAFFLVLARVSPLFLLAPLFSSKSLPGRARGIVALALAVGLMPVVKHGAIDLDVLGFGLLILKEVVVGLAFAYALAAMFAALQAAGTLLDTLIGFSFGAMVDPVTGTQSGATRGSSRASAAPTTRCRCSTRRRSARWSRAPRWRSAGSS
jgi:flagellar biosynthetic protein FliR